MYDEGDIVLTMKLGKLWCAGHVARMDHKANPRMLLAEPLLGTRKS